MKIPDFKKRIQETSIGGQFQASTAWFSFQRKIISEVYGDFDSFDAFKIYLYLCKHFDAKKKFTNRTKEKIMKDLKYASYYPSGAIKYKGAVDTSLKWLEQERFIDRIKHPQYYRSTILVAPDYHLQHKKFYPCDQIHFEPKEMKDHFQGYIMVPKTAIKDSYLADTTYAKRKWTERKLKALLLLYAYCWIEYYGGIDPQTVQIDQQGNLTPSERFCMALKSSQYQVEQTLISLIKEGLFQPVQCVFEDGIYMGDVGTYHPDPHANIQIVLRPIHLIEHKLRSELMQIKKGYMRL